jgi:predicted transposase/invertase (TIGR01784 family)
MNYARETGYAVGRAEGHAEGHAEGKMESTLEIARKMKNAGRSINEITEFTGLPKETVERM